MIQAQTSAPKKTFRRLRLRAKCSGSSEYGSASQCNVISERRELSTARVPKQTLTHGYGRTLPQSHTVTIVRCPSHTRLRSYVVPVTHGYVHTLPQSHTVTVVRCPSHTRLRSYVAPVTHGYGRTLPSHTRLRSYVAPVTQVTVVRCPSHTRLRSYVAPVTHGYGRTLPQSHTVTVVRCPSHIRPPVTHDQCHPVHSRRPRRRLSEATASGLKSFSDHLV